MAQTVLIVDDESCFRLIARQLLEIGGFNVLGEAGSGAQALSAARDLRPDVVLLDVQLPDTDGFAISRQLTQAGDGPRVVLCSVRAAEDYALGSDQCGAAGFLSKSDLSAEAVRRLVAVEPLP
jgi:DNA-binding NarL/FixJ family response regulator